MQNLRVVDLANRRFPDFIIAGAMKCGTTSLHHILASHPKIFIPKGEIHFYDIDDFIQHPDFFFFAKDRWYYPHFDEQLKTYLDWYERFFKPAENDKLIGEDSTTYIASEKAAERISKLNPRAKIIIMLRDPATRTYSHYWHLVRTGRAMWDFERCLQTMPETLIQRSLYRKQIELFLRFVPYENVHFILLEEFIHNLRDVINGVCSFLGVTVGEIDIDRIDAHKNQALLRRNTALQLWFNRTFRLQARKNYLHHLIEAPTQKEIAGSLLSRLVNGLHNTINPPRAVKPPRMVASTRKFLNDYFRRENIGLSKLIGKNTEGYWYRD